MTKSTLPNDPKLIAKVEASNSRQELAQIFLDKAITSGNYGKLDFYNTDLLYDNLTKEWCVKAKHGRDWITIKRF